MDIQICLIGSNTKQRTILTVSVDHRDKISDIKRKIGEQIRLTEHMGLRLIIAGTELKNNEQLLSQFNVGIGTIVHALICEIKEEECQNIPKSVAEKNDITGWKSQFYVFCKSCKKWKPGKLRVRCSNCKSNGLLPLYEPSCWNDILHNKIACQCLENNCVDSHVIFYFKCNECNNEAAPLIQMKSNTDSQLCAICGEILNPVIVFSCLKDHISCINCFVLNGIIKLEDRDFVLHPNYGYTLNCPAGCDRSYIADPHHFRLLGEEMYEKYQRLSAEMYLLGEGGTFCPNPKCGTGFIADAQENNEGDKIVLLCPECKFSFCRSCKQRASECFCKNATRSAAENPSVAQLESSDDTENNIKSFVVVQKTSKLCPKCKAPTFKDGGCNHMSCGVCRFTWCWVCIDEWKEDCQWNHWFE